MADLEALGDRIAEGAAHLDAAMHRLLTDVREFDRRGGWVKQGARTCAHWLSWRVGWDLGTAREHVRVAGCLAELPEIDRSLECGELSYSKVRAITRVATPANEHMLLELARLSTAHQLETICRKYAAVKRHGTDATPADDQRRRYVTRRDTADGMVRIEALLHPEEAALVWAALEHAAKQICRDGHARGARRPAPPDALTPARTERESRPLANPRRGDAASSGSAYIHTSANLPTETQPPTGSSDVSAVTPPRPATGPWGVSAETQPRTGSSDVSAETPPRPATRSWDVSAETQPPTGSTDVSAEARPGMRSSDVSADTQRQQDQFSDASARDRAQPTRSSDTSARRRPVQPTGSSDGGAEPRQPAGSSDARGAVTHVRRPPSQFDRADALVALAQSWLRGAKPERAPVDVVVTVEAAALRTSGGDPSPAACVEDGTGISTAAARRLSCDAGLVAFTIDERGEPLSVGRRTRTISGSLKRALLNRDRACRFPGCTNRLYLEGHHIQHWADGGETSLANTLLLCSHHHRFVHEYGYAIAMTGHGTAFRDPRGRAVPDVPPPAAPPDLGWPAILAVNEPYWICPETNESCWDGTSVDYPEIIDQLVRLDDHVRQRTA